MIKTRVVDNEHQIYKECSVKSKEIYIYLRYIMCRAMWYSQNKALVSPYNILFTQKSHSKHWGYLGNSEWRTFDSSIRFITNYVTLIFGFLAFYCVLWKKSIFSNILTEMTLGLNMKQRWYVFSSKGKDS